MQEEFTEDFFDEFLVYKEAFQVLVQLLFPCL